YDMELVDVGPGHSPEKQAGAHRRMAAAMDRAFDTIRRLQTEARSGRRPERPRWPMIVLRSPKGWTGVARIDGHPVEGPYRAHQVRVPNARSSPEHLRAVEGWLRSYHPEELFDLEGQPSPDVLAACPLGDRRMGRNPHANGGILRRDLDRPKWQSFAV